MDAGWTWLLIQAVSTPPSWTAEVDISAAWPIREFVCLFVFVIKLNIICLQTHRCWHYGGLLTEETDRICIEKKVWTVFLWTIWSACRTSPALPLISLLGCSCSLCLTQTINSQSRVQRSGESPNEPRDTDSGGWMTPARAPGHRERPKRSTVCLHNYSL